MDGALTVQAVEALCAQEGAESAEPGVQIVVNGTPLDPVPLAVWERVQQAYELDWIGGIVSIHHEEAIAPTLRDAPSRKSEERPRPLRILVAHPTAPFRSHLLCELGIAGVDAMGVADGRRAMDSLLRYRPEVLIAQYDLPRLSSNELLMAARAQLGPALLLSVVIGAPRGQESVADLVIEPNVEPARAIELVLKRMRSVSRPARTG